MPNTTAIFKAKDSRKEPLPECHGGIGSVDWTEVVDKRDNQEICLNFVHDDILKPGVSVGIHEHTGDEEYYYIIDGSGIMTLDGEEYEVGPGDLTAVYPGGTHGLKNHTEGDLRILVISVACK